MPSVEMLLDKVETKLDGPEISDVDNDCQLFVEILKYSRVVQLANFITEYVKQGFGIGFGHVKNTLDFLI